MENMFDFNAAFEKKLFEYNNDIKSRKIKISSKIRFENKLKREKVENLITELPFKNESIHIVSNGSFDYFTIIPHIVELSNFVVNEFYFSTWTMSRDNVIQIIDLFDRKILKNINSLTGEYFRSREQKVYSILENEIKNRKQRLAATKNHAKVTLLNIQENYFVIEGSANFTANPRIEQFVFSNSKELYNFHKFWMDEILEKYGI